MNVEVSNLLDSKPFRLADGEPASWIINRRYKGWLIWKKVICTSLAVLMALIAFFAIAALVISMLNRSKLESESKLQVNHQNENNMQVDSPWSASEKKSTTKMTSLKRTTKLRESSSSSSTQSTPTMTTKNAELIRTIATSTQKASGQVKTRTTSNFRKSSGTVKEELTRLLSKRYAKNMDNATDPCENFYQFACGNYQTEYDIDSPMSQVFAQIVIGSDVMESLGDKNRAQLVKEYAKIDANNESLPKSVRMSKVLYDICAKKLRALQVFEKSPIIEWFRINAGTDWPFVQEKRLGVSPASIWDLLGKAKRDLSADSLLSIGITLDATNPTRYAFVLFGPVLGLDNHEIYTNAKFENQIEEYKVKIIKVVADYAKQNGDHQLHRMLTTEYCLTNSYGSFVNCLRLQSLFAKLENMIAFEKKLATVSLPREDLLLQDRSRIMKVSVADLAKKFPRIDWERMFSAAIPNRSYWPEDVQIMDSNYLERLQAILGQNEAETIYNYVIWRVLQSKKLFLSHALRSRKQRDINQEIEQNSVCIQLLEKQMPAATNWVFAQNQLDPLFNRAEVLLDAVKKAFKERISSLSWMDERSKQSAIEKLALMSSSIGFEAWQIKAETLDQFYGDLEITPNMREFEALKTIVQWNWDRALKALKLPVNSQMSLDIFPSSVILANAANSINFNSILINAGILQFPLYFQEMPEFALFGGLGSILAHEIAHAFGPEGIKYDGQRKNRNWLSDASSQASNQHQRCLAGKYTGFCIEGDTEEDEVEEMCVNEKLASGEIMADVAGLKIAYESLLTKSKDENLVKFPGFENYSLQQLFFLAYGNVWCSSTKKAVQKLKLTGPHPPNRFRVLGALQNFGAFSDAFHCPKESQMAERAPFCETW